MLDRSSVSSLKALKKNRMKTGGREESRTDLSGILGRHVVLVNVIDRDTGGDKSRLCG